MPPQARLNHRVIKDPGRIPYTSNTSPTDTNLEYGPGSVDILTSIIGYAQRRPGFSDDVEETPTSFTSLKRVFTWERFDGTFFIMASSLDADMVASVWKYEVGTDSSFVSIYTEPTASNNPYDFVVSNNTLYFANGFFAKKWDPVNGVTNWGISISAGSGTTATMPAGLGTNSGVVAWNNPNNVTSAVNYADVTLTSVTFGSSSSGYLDATTFGFTVPATQQIGGIAVQFDVITTTYNANTYLYAQLLKYGVPVGSMRQILHNTSVTSTLTVGGSSDMWGIAANYTEINDVGFGVRFFTSQGPPGHTSSTEIRNVQITIFGYAGPVVTTTAGSLSPTIGYRYVFAYRNTSTGHVSSPSGVSALIIPSAQGVLVSIIASTDPQVDRISVYRTTDGGATYFELPTSPYPNTTANITDNAADTSLNVFSIAATPTFNDPPPLWQGMVYFAGRIWGYRNNEVGFTGLEEITVGVPEESVPSGVAGNYWSFDQPVTGLSSAGIDEDEILLIYCGGRIYSIRGNTLDTFRRKRISTRRGSRNKLCIAVMGGMCAWLDTANQIWATNGITMQEIGLPIRPDLAVIDQDDCCLSFHVSGTYHWLVFSTGERLFVYDIDQEIWMPPWSFSCRYLFSGETSPGDYKLMAVKPTKALQLASTFNDDGSTYQPVMRTGLMSVVPESGMSDEPTRSGVPYYVQVDTNAFDLDDVEYEVDEDPATATFTSIYLQKKTVETTFLRENGVNINQQIFPMNGPRSRWIALQLTMEDADQADKVYGIALAFTEQP